MRLLAISVLIFAVVAQKATDYSETVGYISTLYMGMTYCPHSAVQNWVVSPNCSAIKSFVPFGFYYSNKTDALAYIGHDHARGWIVVSFKGTEPTNIKDLIIDLKSLPLFYYECQLGYANVTAHHGFCDYYKSVQMGILQGIQGAINFRPYYQLIVVGHSLGGAAATLCTLDLLSRGIVGGTGYILHYTDGEFRIGDIDLVTQLNSYVSQASLYYYRVVHYQDVVAHLPICCTAPFGHCRNTTHCPLHPPQEVFYNETMPGPFKLCSPTDGEDLACSDSLLVPISVADHTHYYGVNVGSVCCPSTVSRMPYELVPKKLFWLEDAQYKRYYELAQEGQNE